MKKKKHKKIKTEILKVKLLLERKSSFKDKLVKLWEVLQEMVPTAKNQKQKSLTHFSKILNQLKIKSSYLVLYFSLTEHKLKH